MPVPSSDFSGFTGQAPPGTNLAAFVSTRLSLVQGKVVAEFQAGQSWVNRSVVPLAPNRAVPDARGVAACQNHFATNPNAANFTANPSSACPAQGGRTHVALNAGQCETVLGQGLDADRQADSRGRLATHEQYHMRLACVLAGIANFLIAGGSRPELALTTVQQANPRLQAQYDNDTRHGCDAAAQSLWQANIDARKIQI